MIKIVKPTLLIDEQKCRRNIKRMVDKARSNNLSFRPHFKTHQSLEIGSWFKEEGVTQITVSSLGMASYFAKDGWSEITVAFPCNIRQIDLINELASIINLNLLVDNRDVIEMLEKQLEHTVSIFIELDSGKGRTGVEATDIEVIDVLVHAINNSVKLNFKGFYLHAGHSYYARGENEIKTIYNEAIAVIKPVKSAYPTAEICYGDTPTCSIIDDFEIIDAISPGNFVFYDLMQEQIGSCSIDEIAVAVACPVVSINKMKNQICIYGGAVHFSKDFIIENETPVYGKIVKLNDNKWDEYLPNCYVSGLSQEHGIISISAEYIDDFNIGDILDVIPVHSCLTAECLGVYYSKEREIIDHY